MNVEQNIQQAPQPEIETPEERARQVLQRIGEDARSDAEEYLRQMELPEGGE